MASVFERLGLPPFPAILAPLAGITDMPFRRICARLGADLVYTELVTAAAVIHDNKTTRGLLARHADEARLGVQLTGRDPDEIARAIELLDPLGFDTVDINMGCPVPKVVKTGAGAALLRDPALVGEIVRKARAATARPLSVKMRLGWDRTSVNVLEVAGAAEEAGADWVTVHGRTRSEDYGVRVDLPAIARVKASLRIPVIANGNVFSAADRDLVLRETGADGILVARGVLGNPWIFRELRGQSPHPSPAEWSAVVQQHIAWQAEACGEGAMAAVVLRKHLLWYLKGWPDGKKTKVEINNVCNLGLARDIIILYENALRERGVLCRQIGAGEGFAGRFVVGTS